MSIILSIVAGIEGEMLSGELNISNDIASGSIEIVMRFHDGSIFCGTGVVGNFCSAVVDALFFSKRLNFRLFLVPTYCLITIDERSDIGGGSGKGQCWAFNTLARFQDNGNLRALVLQVEGNLFAFAVCTPQAQGNLIIRIPLFGGAVVQGSLCVGIVTGFCIIQWFEAIALQMVLCQQLYRIGLVSSQGPCVRLSLETVFLGIARPIERSGGSGQGTVSRIGCDNLLVLTCNSDIRLVGSCA